MKFRIVQLIILLIMLSSLHSCKENDNIINADIKNSPIIVNTLNAFTMSINAENFSFERTDTLNFSSDSLIVVLTVSNFVSGGGEIILKREDGSIFYSQLINSNKIISDTELRGNRPKLITIKFNNLTAEVSFVLTKR